MDADARIRRALVTIRDRQGAVVGGGVMVSRDMFATCAHVINQVLGRDRFEVSQPTGVLPVEATDGRLRTAEVITWVPARRSDGSRAGGTEVGSPTVLSGERHQQATAGGRFWQGDVALLRFRGEDPQPRAAFDPLPWADASLGREVHSWYGNGDAATVAGATVRGLLGDLVVLDGTATGSTIQPGYSGGPLWDREQQAVVGLVVSAHRLGDIGDTPGGAPYRRAYAIRASAVHALLGSAFTLLPPEPGGPLHALATAQIEAADKSPYTLYETRQPWLSTVYVRQRLSPTPAADTDFPGWLDAADVGAVRSFDEVADEHRHLLVEGHGGLGKSVLSLQVAAERARAWLASPSARRDGLEMALRVTARSLAAHRDLPWAEALVASACADLGSLLEVSLPPTLLHDHGAERWLIIVDGLDEVVDPRDHSMLLGLLAARARSAGPTTRLLITSRPLATPHRQTLAQPETGLFVLEPLDAQGLDRFVRLWFDASADLADAFLGQVNERPEVRELLKVPLLATLAVSVFEAAPDRTLPSNRSLLYASFVSQLLDSRPVPDDLVARLRAWPGGQEAADRLCQNRSDLLDHLARARAGSTESLLAAVRDWLGAGGGSVLPPWWRELEFALATGTGLLVRVGDDVEFLHHSFVEHLAARAFARDLPEQSWAQGERARWVKRACQAVGYELGRGVLVQYATHHGDDGLLDHLLSARSSSRLIMLAVQLVADGLPVDATVMERLCERGKAWLPRGDTYGLWLLRLTPALPHRETVKALLLWTALNKAVDREWRNLAAQTLTDFGEEARPEAARALHALALEHKSYARNGLVPARQLIQLGPEYRELAAAALRTIVTRERHGYRGEEAVIELARMGPEYAVQAAALLDDFRTDRTGALTVARMLADYGPEHRDLAASVLKSIIRMGYYRGDQREALDALVDLGPEFKETVAQECEALIKEPFRSDAFEAAFRTMVKLGYRERAVEAARKAPSHHWGFGVSRWTREEEGVNLSSVRSEALREISADRTRSASQRINALEELATLHIDPFYASFPSRVERRPSTGTPRDEHADYTKAVLRELAMDPTVPAEDRIDAAVVLHQRIPEQGPFVLEALRAVAGSTDAVQRDRDLAVLHMVGLGDEEALRGLSRARLTTLLATALRQDKPGAAPVYDRLDPRSRKSVIRSLTPRIRWWQYGPDAVRILSRISELPSLDPALEARTAKRLLRLTRWPRRKETRTEALNALAALGPEYRREAGARLERWAARKGAYARTDLLREWSWRSSPLQENVMRAHVALILDHRPSVSAYDRWEAARELADMQKRTFVVEEEAREERAEDRFVDPVAAVEQAIANPALHGHVRQELARKLSTETLTHRIYTPETDRRHEPTTVQRRSIEALGLLMQDHGLAPTARRSAAEALHGIGPEHHEAVATVLLELSKDTVHHVRERRLAAESLALRAPERLPEAAEVLAELSGDPGVPSKERHAAAKALGDLGPAYQERAIVALSRTGRGRVFHRVVRGRNRRRGPQADSVRSAKRSG